MLSRPTPRSLGLGLYGRGACVTCAGCQRRLLDLVESDVFLHRLNFGNGQTFVRCMLPLGIVVVVVVVVDYDMGYPAIVGNVTINQAP